MGIFCQTCGCMCCSMACILDDGCDYYGKDITE